MNFLDLTRKVVNSLILILEKLGVTLDFRSHQRLLFSYSLQLGVQYLLSTHKLYELSLVFFYYVHVKFESIDFGFKAGLNCGDLLLYIIDQDILLFH